MSSKHKNSADVKARMMESKMKILIEDRKNFLKMCKLFGLADCDLVFDSASLNESPVDLDDLVANHADAIRNTQELSQLCLDVLAEIFGQEDPRTLQTVFRDRDMSRVRFALGELRQSRSETLVHSSNPESDVSTQTESFQDVAETQTDVLAKVDESPMADLELQISDLQREVLSLKDQIDRKDDELQGMRHELLLSQDRMGNLAILEDVALRQASRDAELALLRAQLASNLDTSSDTDLDSSIFRKNILIKVLTYSLTGEYEKLEHMVPIICAIFHLDDNEATELGKLCASLNSQGILGNILANWK